MRVIEPHQLQRPTTKKTISKRWWIVVPICVIIVVVWQFVIRPQNTVNEQPANQVASQDGSSDSPKDTAQNGPIKQFTGQEFKDLYYSVAYPNVQQITDPLPITGNLEADKRIRRMAEERGYKQTVIPQGSIVKINEPRLEGDDLLQPLAAEGWKSLKETAIKDNVPLSIVSAYRSPEWQRDLFTERLYGLGISASQVADGTVDSAVATTLGRAAVPGYSRHHTGYTVDLWCEDGSGAFVNSSCYVWISKNNYQKAKESGWIPSYPEGTDLQGPEPEPWEYVWIGSNNLR